MGCANVDVETVQTKEFIEEPSSTKKSLIKDSNVFKIEGDTCYLPTELVLKNVISMNPKEQQKVALRPNEIMSCVG